MTANKRILVSLILLPTVALAQRGGGGSRVRGDPKADWQSVMGSNSGGMKLSTRDVENISPIKLLIDKRKDLKLTDDQLNRLKELDGKLKEKNQGSFKALDSLRRLAQPPAHDPNDADRARMSMARRLAGTTVGTIRENYDAARKEALPILDESQQKAASEILDKQRTEADEMLRENLGGRGGG
jgi:hypothetical protein